MTDQKWDKIIKAEGSLIDFRLGELWNYRYLVKMFVRRDFVAAYKQTVLGPLWFVIPPLLSTLTFTVIFGRIAKLSTEGVPDFLFYMSGIVIWSYFSNTLTANSSIFNLQSGLFSKVYFPRLVVPVANFVSGFFSFLIQFGIFICFLAYYAIIGTPISISVSLLLVPFCILMAGMLGLGIGIIVSALTTRYRDLSFLINFGLSLWMYVTPVIYPLSTVPENYRWMILLNPMTPVVAVFRHAFLGTEGPSLLWLLYSALSALACALIGILIFNRVERYAMDTI